MNGVDLWARGVVAHTLLQARLSLYHLNEFVENFNFRPDWKHDHDVSSKYFYQTTACFSLYSVMLSY